MSGTVSKSWCTSCAILSIGMLLGCAGNNGIQSDSVDASAESILRELQFYQKALSGKVFDNDFERAKQLIEQHGAPKKPMVVSSIYARSHDSHQGLIYLIFVSSGMDVSEIGVSVGHAPGAIEQDEFRLHLVNQDIFVTGQDSVGFLQQPLDLFDGDEITSVTEETVVGVDMTFDQGLTLEQLEQREDNVFDDNAVLSKHKATEAVLLIPKAIWDSEDVYLCIYDSKGARSNQVKIGEWFRPKSENN